MANTKRIKVGDKVKVVDVGGGNCGLIKVGMIGKVTETDNSGVPYKVFFEETGEDNWLCAQNVVLCTEWVQGDILIDDNGNKTKILAVCGEVYFISQTNDHTRTLSFYTKAELDERWKKEGDIVEEAVEELTMEEVCERLGKTIKIKKA